MTTPTTLADWTSQGLDERQGASFAQDIQSIAPLALFARALPGWVEKHSTAVRISIECAPGMGGAGIAMSFGRDSLPVAVAQDLVERLTQTSRLMELETLVETMRGSGAPPAQVDALVEEADRLAQQLDD
jgi:hypothetical protein